MSPLFPLFTGRSRMQNTAFALARVIKRVRKYQPVEVQLLPGVHGW
jgi:hypothetical protein